MARTANRKAILLDDVEHLGHRGEIVAVSRGYLRNYLVPRKLDRDVAGPFACNDDVMRNESWVTGRQHGETGHCGSPLRRVRVSKCDDVDVARPQPCQDSQSGAARAINDDGAKRAQALLQRSLEPADRS